MQQPLPRHFANSAASGLNTRLGDLTTALRRDQIIDILRSAILSGELQDDVIYPAPAIANQLGVSTTPVREAMIALSLERLVTVMPNRGFVVTVPTPEEIDEMLETRLLLEVPTVRGVAARGLGEGQYEELGLLADRIVSTAEEGDFSAHVFADLHFHVGLIEAYGNAEITGVVRALRARWRLHGLNLPQNRDFLLHSAAEHRVILEAVREQRVDDAAELLERHMREAGAVWKRDSAEGR